MDTLLQDVRYALRMLLKSPGFAAVAALTLALGIGANTAIFSVVNGALLRPLPYPDPDRLALVTIDRGEHGRRFTVSNSDFLTLKEGLSGFESLAAFQSDRLNFRAGGEPERVPAMWVTADFFTTLGVPPRLGRTFAKDEDRPGTPPSAVVSDALWRRRLAGDPAAVGRAVTIDGRSYTVIGVMPPKFAFPRVCDVWPILQIDPPLKRPPFHLRVVGRIRPGVGATGIGTELGRMHDLVERTYPDKQEPYWAFESEPLKEVIVGDVRPALLVLLVAVGFVLLIATANVSNLLLSRGATREKEMALRAALGASRRRLVRQLLTESLILAALGGGLGLLAGMWGIDLLRAIEPGTFPRLAEIRLDRTALLFTSIVSLASGVLFGLAPALQFSRAPLNESLKQGGRSVTEGRGRQRLRGLLVITQTTLALILLVGAGLLIRSFQRLQDVQPGFESQGLLVAPIALPQSHYAAPVQRIAFYRELVDRLRALPGVEAASYSDSVPLAGLNILEVLGVEGQPVPAGSNAPLVEEILIGTDYLRALGIPLMKGRSTTASDGPDDPPVVLINETLARRYFPGEDPVGRRIRAGGFGPYDPWITIVGVVGDVKNQGLDADRKAALYVPYDQLPMGGQVSLLLRCRCDPESLVAPVRRLVQGMDPALPLGTVLTGGQLLIEATGRPRFQTLLLALFAGVALLLAAVGIYGVVSYSASQRTHEIGVRLALGARPRDVVSLVLTQGMRPVLAGVGAGLAGAFALTRELRSLLFGVTATDPLTFAVLALFLAAVALAACYLPARRATRVDPMIALRAE